MKNLQKFTIELIVTALVAFVLSALVGLILSFIAGNLDIYRDNVSLIAMINGVVFGLVVGYKLNSLLREHKK